MSVPSSKCRICLEEKPNGELVPVSSSWQENASKSIKEIIRFCVPAVSIRDDSQICSTCRWQLKFAYFFIERCLITEKILLPDTTSKLDNLLGKSEDCEDTINIIIENDENGDIIKNEDFIKIDEADHGDHSYFIPSKNEEKIKVELHDLNDNDNFDDDWLNNVDEVGDSVGDKRGQENVKTSRRKKRKTSITENVTNSFPEGILEILDFAATNVMCLSVNSDMTKENHDDLIQNGINVINMSSGSTKKKRVIYVGRDLEYRVHRCIKCDLNFGTACDYADHIHLHHKGKIKLPDNVGFKCNQCDSAFISEMAYKQHYKIAHNSSRPHMCKKCNKKFRNAKELQNHTKTFEDQEKCVLTCQKCNRNFKRDVDLQRHNEFFKASAACSVWCAKCDKEFATEAALRAHEADADGAPSCDYVKCRICSQKFTKELYKSHLLQHNPEHLCPECGKCFYTSTSLRSHQKNVHVKGNSMCHECGKVMNPGQLRQHMQTAHSTSTFMCDKCPKQFKSTHYLRKHRQSHDVKEKCHTCDTCGRSFYTKPGLREHIALLHLGNAKLECPMCGEGFRRSDYLKRHIKYHEKYMKLSCKVCKMSFSTKGRLLTHETHGHDENGKPLYIGRKTAAAFKRTKTEYRQKFFKYNSKPCVCSICNKVVANSQYLKMHFRSHLKIKDNRYKCEKCNILYQSGASLKRHMDRHKDPNFEFSCKICYICCRSRSELATHIAKTHKTLKYCCKYCPSKFGRKYLLYSHENMTHKEELSKKNEVYDLLTKQEYNYNIPEGYVRPKNVKGVKFDYLETNVDELIQQGERNLPMVSQSIPESDFDIFAAEYQMEETVDELDNKQTNDEDYSTITQEEEAALMQYIQ